MSEYYVLTGINAIKLTLLISSIGIIISMLEKLYTFNNYKKNGILNWNVSRTREKWTSSKFSELVLDPIFYPKGYKILIFYSLIISSFIPLIIFIDELIFPLSLLTLIGLVVHGIRNIYGNDGSSHMNVVIYISGCIYGISLEASISQYLSLWFIAIQYVLSLFIAGAAKFSSKLWRSGEALTGIMSSIHYGDKKLYQLLKTHKNLSKVISWFIISVQCVFGLIFFVNPEIQITFIILGFIFHLLVSYTMGLNDFFFAFVGCYPVVWFCAQTGNFI